MARKVFISVLGAGFYTPCIYGDTGIQTRFIQVATLLNIEANKWSSSDTGIVLLTKKARYDNWEVADNMRSKYSGAPQEEYIGLKQEIDRLKLPFTVQDIDIPDGKNEEEMWTIFTTLFNNLKDGDELYIDLTHSFRYLPMLVLVLTNYAKFIKSTTVKSLTYGNFEVPDKIKPIMNLLPIAALQDWTYAAADYLNNGYAKGLKEMTETTLHPLMREESTRNRDLAFTRSFSSTIEKISNERIMCRGKAIVEGKNVDSLIRAASQIEEITVAPLKPVIDRIIASVRTDSDSDIKRCIDAARWCKDKHLYQQAITILQEGIVSFFCQRHGIDIDDKEKRDLVNIAFALELKPKKNEKTLSKYAVDNIRTIIHIIKDEYMSNRELVNLFSNITDLRNVYNHSGYRKEPQNIKTMTDNVKEFIDTAARIFT